MLLGNLLKSISHKYQKVDAKGISFDSRKVKKGDIFFAIKGNKTSGVEFIKEALKKGASIIVVNKSVKYKNNNIKLILVKDVRQSLSEACSNFYNKKPKKIIAVTGTNGKSSVADFFYQILSFNKISAGSIGTLGIVSKKHNKKTKLTSADPIFLHKNLQKLKKNKVNNVILEASSHGLEQKRLDNLNINLGIFTNLSHDHLDYHKNIQTYFNCKTYLFKKLLNKKSTIISDEDIKEFNVIKNIAKRRQLKIVSIGRIFGDIKILSNSYNKNLQIINILYKSKIYNLHVPLIGYFQIKNLLMAILAASDCGVDVVKSLKHIEKIKPVPGRLELIAQLKNNSSIILDFAHTPEALKKSLIEIKKQFNKKIIIVFGCGGERDKSKRYKMGKIAQKYCRKIFVTDDNPRNENPQKIRKDILKGCKEKGIEIGNRENAIKYAIHELEPNEILLVAGKGHEVTQIYGDKVLKFSDKKTIKKIIKKNKNLIKKSAFQDFLLQKSFKDKSIKNINYSGVSINSKSIEKNNLFFAVKGKKIDGHNFLKESINKGAIKSIVSKKNNKISNNKIIQVKNTFHSLNNLAKVTRDNTSAKIIGITGSAGKTTLKNLVSFSLQYFGKVYHSPHSYNNSFGVPLSIANLKQNTDFGVFEIGMNKKGEIKKLSKIVKPEIAIITNISEAHLENFNSLKDIAEAKGEIVNNITKNGNIILNKDDRFFSFLSNKSAKKGIKVTSFGFNKTADIFLISKKKINDCFEIKVSVYSKTYYFNVKNSTNNFINNILACISVLYILGLNLNKIKKKFKKFLLPSGRGDIKIIKKFNKKFKFIDESYNANPLSMKHAINNINSYKIQDKSKKIVLLGDMLELGKKSKQFHKNLSILINKTNIDKVFVCGKHIKNTFDYLSLDKKGKVFINLKEAYIHLGKILHNNDLLMVKGSNATGMNKFSKNLKKGQSDAI